MPQVRRFINKLKKSANVPTQDIVSTLEPEEEQERFEEDAAATILSLLKHKPEEEVLKPYYDYTELMLDDQTSIAKKSKENIQKKDVPVAHQKSLMSILKGTQELADSKSMPKIRVEKPKPKADVSDLLKILKQSPIPNSDDENPDLDVQNNSKTFKFNLDIINDLLSGSEYSE
eukprot:NODE_94_length_21525_cov_0.751003.p12 type:complete len:174 gc:universal NODE_94_length_21525_cov_0.751003:19594-19073(-)